MTKFPKIDMPEKGQPIPLDARAESLVASSQITPRDFFAAMAMQALIQSRFLANGKSLAYEVIPAESFKVADEMMFIRRLRPKK